MRFSVVQCRCGKDLRFGLKQLLNAFEGVCCGLGTGGDGFLCTEEIIPGQMLDLRPEDQIGRIIPEEGLMLPRGADGSADDLKDVCGVTGAAIMQAGDDSDDRTRFQAAGFAGGDRRNKAAVDQAPRSNLDGFKQAREGAACSKGFCQAAMPQNDGIAGAEVGGHGNKRNQKILKRLRRQDPFDQIAEPMVAGYAQP